MPTSDEAITLLRERTASEKPTLAVSEQEMSNLSFIHQLSIALDGIGIGIQTLHTATGECCLWHAILGRVFEIKPYDARLHFLSEFFDIKFEPGIAGASAQGPSGRTPLMRAAMEGQASVMRGLLEAGAGANAKDQYGWSALTFAASQGSTQAIRVLLEAGADIHTTTDEGYTPLMAAASEGHADAVSALIEAATDVNAKDEDGTTALMLAAHCGHADVVRVLLDAGADAHLEGEYGGTALRRAETQILTGAGTDGHHAVVQLLKSASCS
ncbi:MAG: ankyrin repeat domain-containing protein [Acidobacteria bacterium]|nr:ankyrin repeat domain-containing protein [Acidobacteriota bacterium]